MPRSKNADIKTIERRTARKNDFALLVFSVLLGAVSGGVIWVYLHAVGTMTKLLWVVWPDHIHFFWYPLVVCLLGGLLMGLIHRGYPQYPEDMETVMTKINRDRHYEYHPMLVMLLAAFIPLIIGASVGPEAGLTGAVAGLCYWVGDNISFAKGRREAYAKMGAVVALGMIFHAPLFGLFSVDEDAAEERTSENVLPGTFNLLTYGLALSAGMGVYAVVSSYWGDAFGSLPSFGRVNLSVRDYPMVVVYTLAGTLLYVLYDLADKLIAAFLNFIPILLKELVGGLVLGVCMIYMPMLTFSGESRMNDLIVDYPLYTPAFLAATCLLKVVLTSFCVRSGLRGGNIFAIIFGSTCLGYAIAMQVFGADAASHVAFAAAIVNAAALGGLLKKPIPAALVLLLCFPPKVLFWTVLAAGFGSFAGRKMEKTV